MPGSTWEKIVLSCALGVFIVVSFVVRYQVSSISGNNVADIASAVSVATSTPVTSSVQDNISQSAPEALISAAAPGQSSTNAVSDGNNIILGTPAETAPFVRYRVTPTPNLAYEEALVGDINTGNVLLSANDTVRWPLASLSKLMTATLVFDNFNLQEKITITPSMMAVDPGEKTLVVGGTYTVSDLLHVMLLPSSNVAAEAFAETYGRTAFMAAMNARAASWGMRNTFYNDPSGLSAANESTARDMFLLAQKVYADYPQILSITDTPHIMITELNTGTLVPVNSINYFAGQADFVGGKTGYTDQADANLLSIFSYENQPVILIVMGTSEADRFNITQSLFDWFKNNFR